MGRVGWSAWWFLLVVPHPLVVWEVVVNTDCELWSHQDGFPGVGWSALVSGGVWVGRWGGCGGGGPMGRVGWTVGWFLLVVPHPVVVWEVVVNTDCELWSHQDGFPGVGSSALVSGGVWVGRWGGCGGGGPMGRVGWTVGWFLPVVPHPVVVWEVVVNTDCELWSHQDGFPGVGWSALVSGGVWVGRWGGCGGGGPMGRVGWTVGWFLPVVPHPVVVWEVVVNTDCELWSHQDGFPGVGSSALVSGGVWVGRWGGCGCGGPMGRVGWTVGWFLLVVPHPVVVWEVVVNTDCELWSHQDGFPGVGSSALVSGGVWVGRWGGCGGGGPMGRVGWTVGWFLPVVPHPVVVWEVVVNTDCELWSHQDGFPGVGSSALVSGGVWVGRWGGCGGGGPMGRVGWTVGWFLLVVPHPVVVWEVVVNTDCELWSHQDGFPGVGSSALVSGGVWVGRWGGCGGGGPMGRVGWTVGWFLPVVPHPVVVWEVVVNTDCELWSHQDGFPGVGSSALVSGGVWVGRWGGCGGGGPMGRVGWTVGWFLLVVPHPVVVWEVVVNTDCELWSHQDGFPGVGSSALVSGGVWVGRWGGCGCGGLMGRVGWTVGWFLPVVPHPVVVWEVVVNTDCELWSHQDGFPGVGSSALVSGGVWVGRWGGCGCGGLMGRVGWTVGWFLPVVPHPVVVWEVVVNTDCELWSHQDGFPGVGSSALVSGGVWVGRWGGCGGGGPMGRVGWTVGWFLPVVPHPVVVWEVVVNTDCELWSHQDGFPGVGSSALVSGGVWVGRWGGCGGGGPMGRVGWTVGWFLPVVPHPVVVWEVVVNTDCELWSHQDGFPGVGSSALVSGGVWVGRWGGCGFGGPMGRVGWTVGWFLLVVPHPWSCGRSWSTQIVTSPRANPSSRQPLLAPTPPRANPSSRQPLLAPTPPRANPSSRQPLLAPTPPRANPSSRQPLLAPTPPRANPSSRQPLLAPTPPRANPSSRQPLLAPTPPRANPSSRQPLLAPTPPRANPSSRQPLLAPTPPRANPSSRQPLLAPTPPRANPSSRQPLLAPTPPRANPSSRQPLLAPTPPRANPSSRQPLHRIAGRLVTRSGVAAVV